MCVAATGKVISANETEAVVDFHGNLVNAKAGLVQVKPGDEVLVHAGCIIQVISKKEIQEMTDLSDILKNVGAY